MSQIKYITVKDAAGNEVSVRPVDAREIVAHGGSYITETLPEKQAPEKKQHPAEAKKKAPAKAEE